MKKNMNNVREIEILNSKVRMALLQMRAYNGHGGDMGYFALITPCLDEAFKLFELGWGPELWGKPYIRGMMSAAFKHAIADIAANSLIYDPNRVEYEEYLGWVSEEERKLEELDLDEFENWCEAMQSYVDCAGGLAPGHRQIHAEIERLIGKTE